MKVLHIHIKNQSVEMPQHRSEVCGYDFWRPAIEFRVQFNRHWRIKPQFNNGILKSEPNWIKVKMNKVRMFYACRNGFIVILLQYLVNSWIQFQILLLIKHQKHFFKQTNKSTTTLQVVNIGYFTSCLSFWHLIFVRKMKLTTSHKQSTVYAHINLWWSSSV